MNKIIMWFLYTCFLLLFFYNVLIQNMKIVKVDNNRVVIEIFGADIYKNY